MGYYSLHKDGFLSYEAVEAACIGFLQQLQFQQCHFLSELVAFASCDLTIDL